MKTVSLDVFFYLAPYGKVFPLYWESVGSRMSMVDDRSPTYLSFALRGVRGGVGHCGKDAG